MAEQLILEPVVYDLTVAPVTQDIALSAPGPQGASGPTGAPGVVPVFTYAGTLNTYIGLNRFYVDGNYTLTKLRASVGIPPTGSGVTVSLIRNSSVAGTVTIPAGSYTATATLSLSVAANDWFTVTINSVGSTYSGSDLTVTFTLT